MSCRCCSMAADKANACRDESCCRHCTDTTGVGACATARAIEEMRCWIREGNLSFMRCTALVSKQKTREGPHYIKGLVDYCLLSSVSIMFSQDADLCFRPERREARGSPFSALCVRFPSKSEKWRSARFVARGHAAKLVELLEDTHLNRKDMSTSRTCIALTTNLNKNLAQTRKNERRHHSAKAGAFSPP